MGTVVVNSKTKQHGQGHHLFRPRGCYLCPSYPRPSSSTPICCPSPICPPPKHYAPAPYKEEKLPPQPFAYQYGVKDDYSGASYTKSETQDAYGVVGGSYTVALPDGRTQIVTYTADHEGGYIADVKYEGVA